MLRELREGVVHMSVIVITSNEEYEEKVINSDMPALVDFWAPWCGPCKMVTPEVEKVAAEFAGRAVVAKVNVDELKDLAPKYGIRGIPTMIFFKKGEEAGRIVGYKPAKDISAIMNSII